MHNRLKDNYGRAIYTAFSLCLATLLMIVSSSAQTFYTLTDLGTLGGFTSGAADINELNQIVGASTTANSSQHAFFWDNGNIEDLGVPQGYLVSGATDINSMGQITGYTNGDYQSQYAYLIENGEWAYLGTLPNLDYSVAVDINNNGQVVGYSFMLGPDGGSLGWIWEDEAMIPLSTLGGERSQGNAISEAGEVAGYAQIYNPDSAINHACIWVFDAIIDLGVLPGETNSAAYDINDNGQVVGSSSHQQITYPFLTVSKPCLWQDGEVYELPLVEGFATGATTSINNNGQVVGSMRYYLSGGDSRAFIWDDGEMTDLNNLVLYETEWELWTASAINDAGMIVGAGLNPDGQWRGYLLTPEPTAILEPDNDLPSTYLVIDNYPNPFNSRTTIKYELPNAAQVNLDIYDILGQKIETLVKGYRTAGRHQVSWDAEEYASGVYFYNIKAGGFERTERMTLIK